MMQSRSRTQTFYLRVHLRQVDGMLLDGLSIFDNMRNDRCRIERVTDEYIVISSNSPHTLSRWQADGIPVEDLDYPWEE